MAVELISREIEQLAVTPGTPVFTVPGSTTAQIVSAVAVNIDTANATGFTVQINSGGGLTNYIPNRTIPAGKTDLCPELVGMVLEKTDIIHAFAETADDINFKVGFKLIA